MIQGADIVGRRHARGGGALQGFAHHVVDHGPDHAAHGLQMGQAGIEVRPLALHGVEDRADQRHIHQLVQGEQAGGDAVVDVVIVVGDVIGQGRDLGLGRGPGVQTQAIVVVVPLDRLPRRLAQLVGHRTVVLDDPLQRFPGQVQAQEIGIAVLQFGHDPEGLDVVVEAAVVAHLDLELVLAGVTEGRMAQVMAQRDGLGQIAVEAERRRQRARHLRHFQRVRQAGAEIVALVRHEDLGLLLQATEGRRVDDPVTIAGERGPGAALILLEPTALRLEGILGVGRAGDEVRSLGHRPPLSRLTICLFRRGRVSLI